MTDIVLTHQRATSAPSLPDEMQRESYALRLPDELLSFVFEYGAAEWLARPVLLHAFLRIITLVCRRWYQCAIHTPILWTAISNHNVCIPYSLCLTRSGRLPLRVAICRPLPGGEAIFDVLKDSNATSRVSALTMESGRVRPCVPGIHDLVWSVDIRGTGESTNTTRSFLLDEHDWSAVDSVWVGQAYISYEGYVGLFKCLSHARFARLETVQWETTYDVTPLLPEDLFNLPRLEELQLLDILEVRMADILRRLCAIRLTSLVLELAELDGWLTSVFRGISTFSSRCPNLVHLTIDFSHAYQFEVEKLLASMPTVLRLGLCRAGYYSVVNDEDNILPILLYTPSKALLLPALEVLALYNFQFSFSKLREVVESRQKCRQPIVRVGLMEISASVEADEDFQWLEESVRTFEWVPRHVYDRAGYFKKG